jgi:two-component system, chemotaxis family, response regulator PixG
VSEISVIATELFKNIDICSQEKFTGRLLLSGPNQLTWTLYFFVGKLAGDGAGVHPVRRWYRQLLQYCPDLSEEVQANMIAVSLQGGNYCGVNLLLKSTHISRTQALELIESSLLDVLFDIVQLEMHLQKQGLAPLTYTRTTKAADDRAEVPIVWSKADVLGDRVRQTWRSWCSYSLEDCSPNLAPQVRDSKELQRLVAPATYEKLIRLLDGDRTLRDLAIQTKQDLITAVGSILTYCEKGVMRLAEVPDLPLAGIAAQKKSVVPGVPAHATSPKRGLIAHVDDNPLDIQIMQTIITDAGYEYVSVQNPMQALATLLKQPPDLIFLDLIMPIANGYEVCAQFRRVSQFKETPIIFLTSNDGLLDRVRAKMVNSTAFIGKPINTEDVSGILQKYLPREAELLMSTTAASPA